MARLNSGVSVIFSRIHSPTTTSRALAMKGTRHPQAINWLSLITWLRMMKDRVDRMKPIGAPSCGNMPNQAFLPGGAFSVANSTAPPHSPPRPSP